jgi:predicted acyltransferase (DUF342 family)
MLLLSICLLFAFVLALPAIPAMLEIARPKDSGRLAIAEGYVRDPRWFGRAFRQKLAPFIAQARGAGESRAEFHMRTDEDVHWSPLLEIPPSDRLRGIGIGDRIVVGHGAGIRDAYALDELVVERDVVARTLTSDGTLQIADSVRILRWIDADGDIDVGSGSDLGLSASGGARVTLGGDVRFERVWGAPVASSNDVLEPFALDVKPATTVDNHTVADGKSAVFSGSVLVLADTRLPVHLKVHGPLAVEPGVVVAGNIIARGDVTLAANVSVEGHIFAEGNVRLGPGTRVGRPGVAKTIYATGHVIVADDVEVFGWIVSEDGGRTL